MHTKRLKEETKHLHDRVEHVMHSTLLFTGEFTVALYQNFLIQSYRYLSSIEKNTIQHWTNYAEIIQQKTEAVKKDLTILKLDLPSSEILNQTNNSKYYTLGKIYIVLGAMLGNKMIYKALKSNPAFTTVPFFYLTEHQDHLGEIWSAFQNHINQLEEVQLEEVIEGAKTGYLFFGE